MIAYWVNVVLLLPLLLSYSLHLWLWLLAFFMNVIIDCRLVMPHIDIISTTAVSQTHFAHTVPSTMAPSITINLPVKFTCSMYLILAYYLRSQSGLTSLISQYERLSNCILCSNPCCISCPRSSQRLPHSISPQQHPTIAFYAFAPFVFYAQGRRLCSRVCWVTCNGVPFHVISS